MWKKAMLIFLALLVSAHALIAQPPEEDNSAQATEKVTLKVFFYGLIALAPESEGDGVRALLVQADRHQALVGTLDAECSSIPAGGCGSPDGLEWRLGNGQPYILSLEGVASTSGADFSKLCSREPSGKPNNIRKAGLDWIPCMKHIASKYDNVDEKCRGDLDAFDDCESVNVAMDVGVEGLQNAQVCHFPHLDLEDGDRKIYAYFNFRNKDDVNGSRRGQSRVIGDVMELELELDGDSVDLVAEGTPPRRVTLKPANGGSEILLFVSNVYELPNPPLPSNHPLCTDEHEHFAHYYGLIDPDVTVGTEYIPDIAKSRNGGSTFSGKPPSCDALLERFEEKYDLDTEVTCGEGVNVIEIPPHNTRECDLVGFTE